MSRAACPACGHCAASPATGQGVAIGDYVDMTPRTTEPTGATPAPASDYPLRLGLFGILDRAGAAVVRFVGQP